MAVSLLSQDSLSIRTLSSIDFGERANAMAIDGDIAYIVLSGSVRVIDLTYLDSPTEIFSLDIGEDLREITINDTFVLVAGDRFHILTGGTSLEEIGSTHTFSSQTALSSLGRYAYICGGGISVIDMAIPDSPYIVGNVRSIRNTFDITFDGRYFLITSPDEGLFTIDLVEVGEPILGNIAIPNAQGVAVDGSIAVVTSYSDGLFIVDNTDPKMIEVIGFFDGFPLYKPVYINRSLVFASSGEGLEVFHIGRPRRPAIEGYYRNHREISEIIVRDDFAFVLESEGRLVVYALDVLYDRDKQVRSKVSGKFSAFPNPCRDRLFVYSPDGGTYTVSDITGRVISSFNAEPMQTSLIDAELPDGLIFIHCHNTGTSLPIVKLK